VNHRVATRTMGRLPEPSETALVEEKSYPAYLLPHQEARVYLQKVKHLEYEHNNNIRNIAVEGEQFDIEEKEAHESRGFELKKTKKSLKLELAEREWSNAEVGD
jgi:hypothetical protein